MKRNFARNPRTPAPERRPSIGRSTFNIRCSTFCKALSVASAGRATAALLACLILFAGAPPAFAAEPPEIAVEVGAGEIFIGENIDYVVEVRNVKNPSPPDVSALREDFDVTPNGDESRNQSSIMVFNGRRTERNIFSHVYRFRLTPKRSGQIEIPAPSTTVDGKTITGRAVSVNVLAPEEQDVVIPEVLVSRDRVYPTQPFDVTLRVLVRPLPDDADRDPLELLRRRPPHLEVNWVDPPSGLTADDKSRWLQPLLTEDGTGFSLNEVTARGGGFFDSPRAAVFNLFKGRRKRNGLDGRPVDYFVYELTRRLMPEHSGKFSLGPAIVKGIFVTSLDRGQYKPKKLVAIAPALNLEVRDVPEPRPASFCGGIGHYQVTASASPAELRVGDPLTLTLDIERGPSSGSLDLVSAPDLAANSKLAADFEIVDKNPTGHTEGNVKQFTYALRPKRAGISLPAVPVTMFNPDTEQFQETSTEPIRLTVSEASRLGAGELVGELTTSGATEIRSREQGIFQNITDPSELRDQNVSVAVLAELALGVWGAFGCLFLVTTAHRRKLGDVVWQRRRQARRAASQRLSEARAAVASGNPREGLRGVRAAIVGLVADTQNVVAEGLTGVEIDSLLATTSVLPEVRAETKQLLETIESAEYGSGIASGEAALIERAEGLVNRLARHLERGA